MGNGAITPDAARVYTGQAEAETAAAELAVDANTDAAIVEDASGEFSVHPIDEVAPASSGRTDLVRDATAGLELPDGATVRSVFTGVGNDVEEVVLTADTGQLETRLRDFPGEREQLSVTVSTASRLIEGASTSLARLGQPVAEIDRLARSLGDLHSALERGDHDRAAELLAGLEDGFTAAAGATESSYAQRILERARTGLLSRVQAMEPISDPPAALLEQSRALLASYSEQTETTLNSIFADGYANFIDTFGMTGRVRPHDAASAYLRLNASLWTVGRDLRNGAVQPSAFERENWDQVTPRDMYDLALRRLEADSIDYEDAIEGMLNDPQWPGVTVYEPGERPALLEPDAISSFWERSIFSTFAPNEAAEWIEELPISRTMRDGAVAAAAAEPGRPAEIASEQARISTVYQLFQGGQMPSMSSQALLAATAAAGEPIAIPSVSAADQTRETLQARVEAGEIAGFHEAGGGFIEYRLREPTELAGAVLAQADAGALDHLGSDTVAQIRQMMGPANEPGRLLATRMENEEASRWWRELGADAITIAAAGAVSLGAGAVVEGVAVGARASAAVVRASNFIANSVTFTTLYGLAHGEIDPARYPIDMAMFGLLGVAGRFSRLAGALIPQQSAAGRFLAQTAGHATAITSASAVLTGFGALEQAARGHSPTWEQTAENFGRNLMLVSVLHGFNTALLRARPELAPGAAVQREYQRLEGRLREQASSLGSDLAALSRIAETAATRTPTAADVQRAEALMARINTREAEVGRLRAEVEGFVNRYVPQPTAQEIIEGLRRDTPEGAARAAEEAVHGIQAAATRVQSVRFPDTLRWLDPSQNPLVGEVAPGFVQVLAELNAQASMPVRFEVTAIENGAARWMPPDRIQVKPTRGSDPTLSSLEASARLIEGAHEAQHARDAYAGPFALREALLSPSRDVFQQLILAELRAHARQAQVAQQLQDAGIAIPNRHQLLLANWNRSSLQASARNQPQSLFSIVQSYLSRYRYGRAATVEETTRFLERNPSFIDQAFEIFPPR